MEDLIKYSAIPWYLNDHKIRLSSATAAQPEAETLDGIKILPGNDFIRQFCEAINLPPLPASKAFYLLVTEFPKHAHLDASWPSGQEGRGLEKYHNSHKKDDNLEGLKEGGVAKPAKPPVFGAKPRATGNLAA